MSDAFVQSPARQFTQSTCRQRRTRAGFLVFQTLACGVYAHNTDGTPWGWHTGQQVNAAWPDPMGATFYPGPFGSAGGSGTGGDSEFWTAHIQPFPLPNNPFLQRDSIGFLPAGVKDAFGWRFTRPGFDHTYTILVCYRLNMKYKAFHGIDGNNYPGGDWFKKADRMKIYPAASGCATFHSYPYNPASLIDGFPGFTVPTSIPAPHRTEVRNTGDPAHEYFPDAGTDSTLDISGGGSQVNGVMELCLFWFERTPHDLPAFPYTLDPSTL